MDCQPNHLDRLVLLEMQDSLRYVVLHHIDVELPHFDLLIETSPGSELFGVRLSDWPITPSTRIEVSSPHRRTYLTYEGEISGQRGRVRRVAAGNCSVEQDGDKITVQLDAGERFCVLTSG